MNIDLGASRRRVLVLLAALLCAAWAYVALPDRLAAQDKAQDKKPAPAYQEGELDNKPVYQRIDHNGIGAPASIGVHRGNLSHRCTT